MAIAACASPLVGIIAEKLFGFKGSASRGTGDVSEDTAKAHALGNALLVCLVVPWALCLFVYTGEQHGAMASLPWLLRVANAFVYVTACACPPAPGYKRQRLAPGCMWGGKESLL